MQNNQNTMPVKKNIGNQKSGDLVSQTVKKEATEHCNLTDRTEFKRIRKNSQLSKPMNKAIP